MKRLINAVRSIVLIGTALLLFSSESSFVMAHEGAVYAATEPVEHETASPHHEEGEDFIHWYFSCVFCESGTAGIDISECSDGPSTSDLSDMLDVLHEASHGLELLDSLDTSLTRGSHEYPQTLFRPPITHL